jgi:hypothetical protein
MLRSYLPSYLIAFIFHLGFFSTVSGQTLEWVKMYGSDYVDRPHSIAIDSDGNTYTVGVFSTTVDFDPGPGVFELTNQGGYLDCYLSKLNSEGELVWARSFAGVDDCFGYDVSIDSDGNVIVAGEFHGTVDFNPGPDTFNLTTDFLVHSGFITKLTGDGEFLWAKQVGYDSFFTVSSLDVDTLDNIYFSGSFHNLIDLDPGPNDYILDEPGDAFDLYLCKWNGDGEFLWAKHFLGSDDERNPCVTVLSGSIYYSGNFAETLEIVGETEPQLNSFGEYDTFVSKLTTDGEVQWLKQVGGAASNVCITSTVDALGSIYLGGYFSGDVDFDPSLNTHELSASSDFDAFVAKLDSAGNLLWAKQFEGDNELKSVRALAIGRNQSVIVLGDFEESVDANPDSGQHVLIADTSNRTFVVSLADSGSFQWAMNTGGWGSPSPNSGSRLAVDSAYNVYITDYFLGTVDFDPGPEVYSLTSPWYEVYVQKIAPPVRVLGTSDNGMKSDFRLYPNPTTGLVWLETNQEIDKKLVYDCFGRMVLEPTTSEKRIDLSTLPNGIYFISYSINQRPNTQKVVLNR